MSADPAITVGDLERALEAYFKKIGYRNMQEILDIIKDGKVTWKSSAKVTVANWI